MIRVGHLVGICMSPLFYADAAGYFKDEKLNVELKFMPNPGDALTALTSGAMNIVHVPFTNLTIAAHNGAPVRIIDGNGAGGIFLIAQGASGIKNIADLQKAKGKGLKIGTMRVNAFGLTTYRLLQNAGLKYDDFQMVWFNDVVSMAAAFEAKAVDLVTHVEPFSTNLVDKMGGLPRSTCLRCADKPRRRWRGWRRQMPSPARCATSSIPLSDDTAADSQLGRITCISSVDTLTIGDQRQRGAPPTGPG